LEELDRGAAPAEGAAVTATSHPAPAPFVPDSPQAWVRLGLAVLIGAIGSVGMWSVVVALPAVQNDFGTTRAAASLAFTAVMLGFGTGGVGMGRLCDRYGIVTALGIGCVGTTLGYLWAGLSPTLWSFVAAHFLIGAGASATFGPLMAEASHWFERRRGFAMTVAASGNYLGGALWPPLVNALIAATGWPAAHITIGLSSGFAVLIVLGVLRARMNGTARQIRNDTAPLRVQLPMSANALTALLCIAGVACCVAMAMPQVHIVAYCGDLGYGAARGAEMLSLMLGFGIISRIGSGYLADKIGGLRTLLVSSLAQGSALVLFLMFDGLTSLYIISALFGLFQGGIVPSYAIIVRESMPAREAATRVGIVVFATVVGMSLGGWLSGVIFDATGSYTAAFVNGIGWNLLNLTIALGLLWKARARLALI
jgi:MFS family permease